MSVGRVSDTFPAPGDHASRPADPGMVPAFYSCTDHNTIDRWDGTTWTTWASAGGIQSIVEGTNITVDDTDPANPIVSAAGGGGGLSASYLGKTTIGATGWNGIPANGGIFKKITTTGAAQLLSVGAYLRQESDNPWSCGVALYSDNAGTPDRLLAFVMSDASSLLLDAGGGEVAGSAVPRWFAMPLAYELAAATSYWVGLRNNLGSSVVTIAYDSGGSDRTHVTGQSWASDWGRYTATTTTLNHSIRARILS